MSNELPEGVEEIGYELYPKNGDQMWESYKKYSAECGVKYDDNLVLNSLAYPCSAFDRIDDFLPDNTVRLPDMVTTRRMLLRHKRYQDFQLRVLVSGALLTIGIH